MNSNDFVYHKNYMQLRKRWLVWWLSRLFIVVLAYHSNESWSLLISPLIQEPIDAVAVIVDIPWLTLVPASWSLAIDVGTWKLYDTRNKIIWWLITQGFTWWSTHPYSGYAANGLMSYQWTWVVVRQTNQSVDSLDKRIETTQIQLDEQWVVVNNLRIWSWVWKERKNILLFKDEEDLGELWYEVISNRRRISSDTEYRRKNIAQSFALIWNIRVIPPSGDLSFMDAAQYDGITRENYEYGYVVVGNQEKVDYGWGICGASSAIYQWIVSNGSLKTPRIRNHTRRYGYLYDAYIDGELVTTPWIDSAVFDGSLDLEMVNTATHPIVLVMNYDWTAWWVEEVFSVGRPTDKQNIEFVSSYPITYIWPSWVGTGEITTRGWCYTWMIGDEKVKRCYRKVSE